MINFLKEYFSLNQSEQRGLILLTFIVFFCFLGGRLWVLFSNPKFTPIDHSALLLSQTYTNDSIAKSKNYNNLEPSKKKKHVYVYFNPNTVDYDKLTNMGFTEKTAATFINYRNKGGVFYKKEDLKKIYGVNDELYLKIEKYIQIKPKQSNQLIKPSKLKSKVIKHKEIININYADSATLTKLKGVGAVLASRIIKYRNLLGGFVSKNQLSEVYGLSESKYLDSILIQTSVDGTVNKININTASWKNLVKHPYISKEMASEILKIRKEKGSFKSVDFLFELVNNKNTYQKLKPYLKVDT